MRKVPRARLWDDFSTFLHINDTSFFSSRGYFVLDISSELIELFYTSKQLPNFVLRIICETTKNSLVESNVALCFVLLIPLIIINSSECIYLYKKWIFIGKYFPLYCSVLFHEMNHNNSLHGHNFFAPNDSIVFLLTQQFINAKIVNVIIWFYTFTCFCVRKHVKI